MGLKNEMAEKEMNAGRTQPLEAGAEIYGFHKPKQRFWGSPLMKLSPCSAAKSSNPVAFPKRSGIFTQR